MWEPALSFPMSWNSMSCTTVPESQSSLESPECGRSAAEATSQTLKKSSAWIQNIFPIYLVEYKNANVPGAAKPDAFRPEKDIILNKVAEKYFDTLHCLYLLGKNKPKKYIYVLEYPNGNSTSRLMIRNLLQKKLPFRLQAQLSAGKVRLIDEVKVVNIEEWNADPELGRYPIRRWERKDRKK